MRLFGGILNQRGGEESQPSQKLREHAKGGDEGLVKVFGANSCQTISTEPV